MALWYHAIVCIIVLTWMQHASTAVRLMMRPRPCQALQCQQYPTPSASPSLGAANSRAPLKAMVFVDGSWLFYSMVAGRGSAFGDPISRALGPNWRIEYKVDWKKFPQIIADNLHKQLVLSNAPRTDVEVVKTVVFTSLRPGTPSTDARVKLIQDFQAANFEVHKYDTMAAQEKCVDISLATEMLYASTVPGALDIAVMVSGDKDFVPAMRKTRLLGKRVALCSMRSNCNTQLGEDSNQDFGVIWLDQHVRDLYTRRFEGAAWTSELELALLQAIVDILREAAPASVSSRDLGRRLLRTPLSASLSASRGVKQSHGSLVRCLAHYPAVFRMHREDDKAFAVQLADTAPDVLTAHDVRSLPRGLGDASLVPVPSQVPVPSPPPAPAEAQASNAALRDAVVAALAERGGSLSSKDLGRLLQQRCLGPGHLLEAVKHRFGFLRRCLEHFPADFQVGPLHGASTAFAVNLLASSPAYLAWRRERERGQDRERDRERDRDRDRGRDGGQAGEDFSKWTKPHLQRRLRARGLPVSGTKAVLVERLRGEA